jgi:Sec-independent protein translocase protein TatA
MTSPIGPLLFLGLIVFGPEKTLEIAQQIGRLLAQVKQAAGQFQQSALEPERDRQAVGAVSNPASPLQEPPAPTAASAHRLAIVRERFLTTLS